MTTQKKIWQPLLFSITLIIGMMLGYKMKDNMPGKDFFQLDKPKPLQEVMDLINSKYVDAVQAASLSDTAIMAILGKLDPHSVFIAKEDLQQVNEDMVGSFFGIGVEFNVLEDTLNITNVIPDGPSFKAGIQTGDQFIKVNDSSIAGKKISAEQIRKLLRGELGSTVKIELLRNQQKVNTTITRGVIPVSSVDAAYMVDATTGYLRLNKFSQTTYREFMINLEQLQKKGLKSLILDLRGNGGGILDEATSIADEFLDGDKLITYTEGKHFPRKEYRCKREGLFEKGKLVVLADEGTASASEILIGALQDWERATIIGRRSFGKGLVQEQYDLTDGSALRLTIARYYTPLGRSIQRPYDKGGKAYYEEIGKRYEAGEVYHADSIKNDTSKVFLTRSGKKVYGGGGITPDVYVAVDSGNFSKTSAQIYAHGTISAFAYKYYVQHKAQLKAFTTVAQFAQQFQWNNADWDAFAAYAQKDSINISLIKGVEKIDVIQHIQASIARHIWRNNGYFEMLNKQDHTVQKALETVAR
ncbi:MAG: S41 family peptidase [Ferruginibacter sp.]